MSRMVSTAGDGSEKRQSQGPDSERGRKRGRKETPEELAVAAGRQLAIPCQAEEWLRFYGLVANRLKGADTEGEKPSGKTVEEGKSSGK